LPLAEEEEEPPLSKEEIIKKLRALGQPITLFGETNWKKYKRLIRCEENKEELSS